MLDCWSLLEQEGPLAVANVFGGIPELSRIPTWDAIGGATDIAEHVRERIAEDAEALGTAGVTPVNLPFLGENYRDAPPPLLSEIARALVDSVPTTSRLYAPAVVGDPHPDHVLVRRLALKLFRQGVPTTLYAELPYAVQFGWPHWVTGAERNPRVDVDVFWNRFREAVPELRSAEAEVVVLTGDKRRRKLDAIRLYRTQFAGMDVHGVLSNPEIHGYEVFWPLGSSTQSRVR